MTVVNAIARVLFVSIAVQASEWKYEIMKVKQNGIYVDYHTFDNPKERSSGGFDPFNRLVAYSNGSSGAFFLFNYETNMAIYFSNGIRYENCKEFDDYIRGHNLKELYYKRRPEGYICQPNTLPPGFSKHLAEIVKHLIDGFSSECQAFSTVLWMPKITSDRFLSSMVGIENLIEEASIQSPIDLEALVGLYQGLGDFFEHFDGKVEFFIKKRIKCDMEKLIHSASQSGFHVLVNLIERLSYSENLVRLYDYLNDQYSFFLLVRKLGGNKNGGSKKIQLGSFVYTIVDVMSVLNKELSLANLRTTLKVYYESGQNAEEEWKKGVNFLQDFIKKRRLEEEFEGLAELLQSIRDEKWIFQGVDMSSICEFLFSLKREDSSNVEGKLEDFLEKLNFQLKKLE